MLTLPTDNQGQGDRRGRSDRPIVRIRDLSKSFVRAGGDKVVAMDNISLDLWPGEITVFLGASGCGKTTLLRAIAGLEEPDAGEIELGGSVVFSAARGISLGPERRSLSMVFQSYALWPHMTAYQNVEYPLTSGRDTRPSPNQIRQKVNEALRLVGIPSLGGQYPSQLSGGQQQRIALARALVSGSNLILFDEPLSNVDTKVREELRIELLALQRELGFTAIFVTHDQAEAMALADRIAVMRQGGIEQCASPFEVYLRPGTPHVARFIGSINELPGTLASRSGPSVVIRTEIGEISGQTVDETLRPGDAVLCMIRPEAMTISTSGVEADNPRQGTILQTIFLGTHVEIIVDLGAKRLKVWQPYDEAKAPLLDEGTSAWISTPLSAVRAMRA